MSLSYNVAKFVVSDALEMIGKKHCQRAVEHILDTIGVGLAGNVDPIATALLNYTDIVRETGSHTILGNSVSTTVLNAAFVNGVLCHALDYDECAHKIRRNL
jgi:2-methylcitrate dehydratase PrpD